MTDRLGYMFDAQKALQTRLGHSFDEMTVQEKTAYIKEYSVHLNQEVNEALYELPFFKPWKDYNGMEPEDVDRAFDAFVEEMIDAWHFFMNMLLPLGVSASQFYDAYVKKNMINHKRQDDGYKYTKTKEDIDG